MVAVGALSPLNVFVMGLHHLRNGELAQAREAFTRVVSADPGMCDGWLGRLATGEFSVEVTRGAYEARRSLGVACGHSRVTVDQLGVVAPVRLGAVGFQVRVRTAADVAVAYAVALGEDVSPQLGVAAKVIEQYRKSSSSVADDGLVEDLFAYVQLCLMGLARRWPEVLGFVHSHRWRSHGESGDGRDYESGYRYQVIGALNSGLLLWKVWALIGTGSPEEADQLVVGCFERHEGLAGEIGQQLRLARGYALRAQGRREDADRVFGDLQAVWASPEVAAAVGDPGKVVEVVTVESLATRVDPWDPGSGQSTVQLKVAERDQVREAVRDEALALLDRQIGMEAVKAQIRRLESSVLLARRRAELGIPVEDIALSFIFSGPAGTGKTTMARVLAQLLFGLGIIARPQVIEVSRPHLVGSYLGQSASMTNAVIDKALGALLFIDEAYSLYGKGYSSGDAFGEEVLNTLLTRMENERLSDDPARKLVVVIAGYDADIDRLLAVNEGLSSRFTTRVPFESYSPDDLVEIAAKMAGDRSSEFSGEACRLLRDRIRVLVKLEISDVDDHGVPRRISAIDKVGNARFMRTIVELSTRIRDDRLAKLDLGSMSREQLVTFEVDDVDSAFVEACEAQKIPLPKNSGAASVELMSRLAGLNQLNGLNGKDSFHA